MWRCRAVIAFCVSIFMLGFIAEAQKPISETLTIQIVK